MKLSKKRATYLKNRIKSRLKQVVLANYPEKLIKNLVKSIIIFNVNITCDEGNRFSPVYMSYNRDEQ
jgi:hypothetical protein